MRGRRRVYGVLVAAALACACATSGTASKPHPSPSPRHTTARPIDQVPPAEAQPWRDLGVTIVPPDGFLQDLRVPASTTVLNHTGGKVDDATARKWAEAELRTTAWEAWGIANQQADFFTPALGANAARADAFGEDESFVRAATSANGQLAVTPARGIAISRMTLVEVPTEVQSQVPGAGGVAAPFAWVEEQVGPAEVDLRKPDGGVQVLFSLAASARLTGITGGEYKAENTALAPIWYWDFQFNCTVSFLRTTCSS